MVGSITSLSSIGIYVRYAVGHYIRVRADEFVLMVILLLYMSVSVVSKLMERSYRYCYILSTSIESFYDVVEVDEVYLRERIR